jgi:hypothetical protein
LSIPLQFGVRFVSFRNAGVLELKVDSEVMGALEFSTVRYAIIQASSKKNPPETLVIPYSDESCLRDLIAKPSIVELGFKCREEAIANLDTVLPGATVAKQKPWGTAMFCAAQQNCELTGNPDLKKNRGIAYRILQCAFSTIVVLFYSKNLVSSMIRMALGA